MNAPATPPPLPTSEVAADELLRRVLALLGASRDITAFELEHARQVLDVPLEQTAPGLWRHLARLTPEWNYLIQYDQTLASGPAFVLDFFSDLDDRPAIAPLATALDDVAAALQQSGYRQQTRRGEHGETVDHQFGRDQLVATVVTITDSDPEPREFVQSITVR